MEDENTSPLRLSGESSRVCGLVVVKEARGLESVLILFSNSLGVP
jgi:hypothetical protein